MKSKMKKWCAAVLSATTLMSMLSCLSSTATETSSDEVPFIMTEDEDGYHFYGPTGCEDVGEEIPDSVTVIESAEDYYEITGKNNSVKNGMTLLKSSSLPDSVDNSQSKYFPEIGNQGSLGSCGSWAQVYYQFTYAMNKELGVETTPENSFSPKWNYNLTSDAKKGASGFYNIFKIMQYQGNVHMSMVPYDGDYSSLSAEEDIWKESMNYRIKDYQLFTEVGKDGRDITSADDSDLVAFKTALNNDEVLGFTTFISSCNKTKITTHSDAPENSKYEGEYIITSRTGSDGCHRMTLVGYNDNIWTDINENGEVDSGEMGAFKAANSWGTDYANDGFIWIAYDAMNLLSSVEGVENPSNRLRPIITVNRIDVRPYGEGNDIYLKYTLNSADRLQDSVTVKAIKGDTEYSYEYSFPMVNKPESCRPCSFDGTDESNDGTFVVPLDCVVPDISSENISDYVWNITFTDNNSDGIALTVKDAEIIDETANVSYKTGNAYPFALDGSSKTLHYVRVNYSTIGDVNADNAVNISDATLIQKYIVNTIAESDFQSELADCDKNESINIKDATGIQRYLAFGNYSYVGTVNEEYTEQQPTTEPETEPTTVEPTTVAPTTQEPTVVEENTVTFTNSLDWSGTIYCYYWSDTDTSMTSWPGKAMTYLRTNSYGQKQYTFEIPDEATYIIISNGSSQTVKIPYSGGEVRYYALSTVDSKGRYNVEAW